MQQSQNGRHSGQATRTKNRVDCVETEKSQNQDIMRPIPVYSGKLSEAERTLNFLNHAKMNSSLHKQTK